MFFLTLMLSRSMVAQSWDFIKENDSIKIYTRVEAGKSLKSYRGVTDINASVEKIFDLMEDIYNTDWWDKKLTHNKVLLYEKDKRTQFYLLYDLPWPVTDRDLCVDVTITIDPVTGERKINAVALNGVICEHNDQYHTIWITTL